MKTLKLGYRTNRWAISHTPRNIRITGCDWLNIIIKCIDNERF